MKESIIHYIESRENDISTLSDKIWEFSEVSLKEYKSCKLFCDMLNKEGFTVHERYAGIETAFMAEYGSGEPIIGILAEYDALSGLSQARACTRKMTAEEINADKYNGHGCGHNLLGAGAFGAALGIKKYLESKPGKGTVRLYGCPGEEAGAAKAFMARDGYFRDLDCALTWHPDDCNEVFTGSCNSSIQVQYLFEGIASHAGGAPELGRSALDAVELLNIGVQFLREHIKDGQRIHYAITNSGGISPNVVQANASVLYYVRSNFVEDALELEKRVDRIAEGAALMTDTSVRKLFIDGTSDTIPNKYLEKLCQKNLLKIGVPQYTEEELEFADTLAQSYNNSNAICSIAAQYDKSAKEKVIEMQKEYGHKMNAFICPYYEGEAFEAGSTDVGDVSHMTPTIQLHIAAWPNGCGGHTWQNVSSAGSSIGKKAAICASKVLASTAIDLYENPDALRLARNEFAERVNQNFCSPIPKDAKPFIPELN